jgi:type I restriction enzyme S subunit
MRVTDDELENVSVVKGDLVVCEGGEPGRSAVWEKAGEPFAIQKALHRVRTAEGILPKFLAYRLAADAWSGVLKKYFTGSTIMHFTGQSLHSFTFALPPTQEQKLIIDKVERRLSVADEIEKELDESLIRAERLRGSVLKSAFEGRLV